MARRVAENVENASRAAVASSAGSGQWQQNPTIVIEHKPVARFRVRGWGVKEIDDPALIRALLEGGDAANPHVARALVREKLFVQSTDLPQEVKFHAPLSFRQPHLIPTATLGYGQRPESKLCLNPRLYWQTSSKPPRAIKGRAWAAAVLATAPSIWVDDPASGVVFPFWLDAAVNECVARLRAQPRAVEGLSSQQRSILQAARILIPRAAAEDWERYADKRIQKLAHRLQRDQYLQLEELFSPLHLAHLRRYFRALEREGYLHRGDSQVSRRLALYREPLSQSIHGQLAALLSRVTAESLRASYSYFGVYLPGAVLERHKDRPQCRWNLSLVWDTRPTRGRHDAWPIYLDVKGRTRQVNLGMGDGLLYRGTELLHWRDRQPARSFTTATFFHFVPSDFSQSLD